MKIGTNQANPTPSKRYSAEELIEILKQHELKHPQPSTPALSDNAQDAIQKLDALRRQIHPNGKFLPNLAAEARLLDAVFNGPKSESPYMDLAITVSELCEKLDIKYEPGKAYIVQDLANVSIDYAERALCGAIDAKVWHEDGTFYWRDGCEPYAPDITFLVKPEDVLHYDEFGGFFNPAERTSCPEILAKSGIDFKGVETGIIWGKYTSVSSEEGCQSLFRPCSVAADATELLFVTKWGGPNSQTRGIAHIEEAMSMPATGNVRFFQKRSSKRGGAGYDYLVMSIPANSKLKDAVICAELKNHCAYVYQESAYYQKLQMIEKINQQIPELEALNDRINDKMGKLIEDCLSHPAANLPFVQMPDIDYVDNAVANPTTMMYTSELAKMVAQLDHKSAEWGSYLLRSQLLVKAWSHYTTEYLKLLDLVHDLYGWLQIYGDHAEITLPDQYTETGTITQTYIFAEQGLGACLTNLETYRDQRANLTKSNQAAMERLLKSMEETAEPDVKTTEPGAGEGAAE